MSSRAVGAIAAAAAVVFLAVQLATGASLGSTQRELREDRRALEVTLVERDRAAAAREDRQARARAAEDHLDALRSRLDALQLALAGGPGAAVGDLLSDLEGARADLAGANGRLWDRQAEVGSLRACFVAVTQALSLVSLDDRARALDVLGSAAPRCREAGAAR